MLQFRPLRREGARRVHQAQAGQGSCRHLPWPAIPGGSTGLGDPLGLQACPSSSTCATSIASRIPVGRCGGAAVHARKPTRPNAACGSPPGCRAAASPDGIAPITGRSRCALAHLSSGIDHNECSGQPGLAPMLAGHQPENERHSACSSCGCERLGWQQKAGNRAAPRRRHLCDWEVSQARICAGRATSGHSVTAFLSVSNSEGSARSWRSSCGRLELFDEAFRHSDTGLQTAPFS